MRKTQNKVPEGWTMEEWVAKLNSQPTKEFMWGLGMIAKDNPENVLPFFNQIQPIANEIHNEQKSKQE